MLIFLTFSFNMLIVCFYVVQNKPFFESGYSDDHVPKWEIALDLALSFTCTENIIYIWCTAIATLLSRTLSTLCTGLMTLWVLAIHMLHYLLLSNQVHIMDLTLLNWNK